MVEQPQARPPVDYVMHCMCIACVCTKTCGPILGKGAAIYRERREGGGGGGGGGRSRELRIKSLIGTVHVMNTLSLTLSHMHISNVCVYVCICQGVCWPVSVSAYVFVCLGLS